MQKLLLISLFLLIFSGCTITANEIRLENYSDLFINDSSISTNFTYSSFKIEDLIANINVSCVNCTGGNGSSYYAGTGLILNSSNYFSVNATYISSLVGNATIETLNRSTISYNNSLVSVITNYYESGLVSNNTINYNSSGHITSIIENMSGDISIINITYINGSITEIVYN